jgi:hypothetical protein
MVYTLEVSGNVLSIIPTGTLSYNTQYTVTLSAGLSGYYDTIDYELENDFVFWFTSQYCPLFTTLSRVKLAAGPYSEQYTDDTIYRMIHRNSIDVIDIYNITYGTDFAYDSQGCTASGLPFAIRRYVECKTAYDLLSLIKLNGSLDGSSGGDQLKTLGDMTIKYGGPGSAGAGGYAPDQNKLKELYNCWNEQLRMIRTISVAVRGFYDESKGYQHPVRDFAHNRIIRGVSFNNSCPHGPWYNSPEWIGYYNGPYPGGPGRS